MTRGEASFGRSLLAAVLAAVSSGCEWGDSLSALPNDTGTEMLRKTVLGSDTLLICITPTLQEPCTSTTAEVVAENVPNLMAVRAEWLSPNVVTLRIEGGDIERLQSRSRSGRVSIRRTDPADGKGNGRVSVEVEVPIRVYGH